MSSLTLSNSKMIILFLIGIFTLSCCTVEHSLGLPEDQHGQTSSSISPIARWIELYGKIYESSPTSELDTGEINSMLVEMSNIEKNEQYKVTLESINEYTGHSIYHNRHMLERFYESNLMVDPDATITDVLLQTFDPHSNDCTASYFKYLDDIHKTFELVTNVVKILRENREEQYKNCWQRMMTSLYAINRMLGPSVHLRLNDIVSIVHPNPRLILDMDSISSSQLVKIVAQYLLDNVNKFHGHRAINYERVFEQSVQRPCELVTKMSREIMNQIYGMLRYSGIDKDFIKKTHSMILNRYMVCLRMVAEREFIIWTMNQRTAYESQQPTLVGSSTEWINAETGSWMYAHPMLRANPQHVNLITQNPYDQTLTDIPTEAEQQRLMALTKASQETLNYPRFSGLNSSPRRVLSFSEPIGTTKNSQYEVRWSDGTTSTEKMKQLEILAPELVRIRRNKNKFIYRCKLRDKKKQKDLNLFPGKTSKPSSPDPGRIGDPVSARRVKEIKGISGKGPSLRYIVEWSDGEITKEEPRYLKTCQYKAWKTWRKVMKADSKERQKSPKQ